MSRSWWLSDQIQSLHFKFLFLLCSVKNLKRSHDAFSMCVCVCVCYVVHIKHLNTESKVYKKIITLNCSWTAWEFKSFMLYVFNMSHYVRQVHNVHSTASLMHNLTNPVKMSCCLTQSSFFTFKSLRLSESRQAEIIKLILVTNNLWQQKLFSFCMLHTLRS